MIVRQTKELLKVVVTPKRQMGKRPFAELNRQLPGLGFQQLFAGQPAALSQKHHTR
jgi:hypothetical protein